MATFPFTPPTDVEADITVEDSVAGFDGDNWPTAAAAFGIAIILAFVAKRLVEGVVSRHNQVLGRLLGRTVAAIVLTVGLISALSNLGIQVGVLLGALGVTGFALAFAMQDTLSNMIAGIILQVRRPFSYDDKVCLDGYSGTVTDINLRSVEMRLLSGEIVLIPSSEVLQNPIENWTRLPVRRLAIDVGVSYDEDVGRVSRLLAGAMADVPGILEDPAPVVDFVGFGGSSIDFTVYGWFESRHPYFDLRVAAGDGIKRTLDEAGIDIPFPITTLMNVDGSKVGPAAGAT